MKKLLLIAVGVLLFQNLKAQSDSLSVEKKEVEIIKPEWVQKNKFGVDLS